MFKTVQKNGCIYLYQLQTVFPQFPVLPLYLKLNASSKFKLENLNEMFYLRDKIEKLGLICFCISTDGDNGIDHYHQIVFQSFDQFVNEENEVIAIPKSAHPILDLYHALKTQRARFFRQDIALSPNSPVFKREIIQKLVDRGPCFNEMNDTIKFKDEYAIDFYWPISFLEVISSNEIIGFSYFLLPFILWQVSIRYKNLSTSQRLYFLNITFLIFKKEYDDFQGRNSDLHFYEENVEDCEILSFWSKSSLFKYMNTLIALIYIIKKYPDRLLLLQRLTNYPIEKSFGNTRDYMNNSIDEALFTNVLVHEVLRKEMNEYLDLENTSRPFNESGGVVISPDDVESFTFDKEKIEEEIDLLGIALFHQNLLFNRIIYAI